MHAAILSDGKLLLAEIPQDAMRPHVIAMAQDVEAVLVVGAGELAVLPLAWRVVMNLDVAVAGIWRCLATARPFAERWPLDGDQRMPVVRIDAEREGYRDAALADAVVPRDRPRVVATPRG